MTMSIFLRAISALLLITDIAAGAPLGAEDTTPEVSFGAFPLPLKRTYVSSALGLPADKAELQTPFPNDFPPFLTVMLEDTRKFPDSRGRYYFPSRNIVRVYRISEVETAPYKTIQPEIDKLRKILDERPSAPGENRAYYLPDYPSRNAMHCFQLKTAYIDADWGRAVCYVTQFSQDGAGGANNQELTYLVQGLSKDGAFYVSADFSITHPKLPDRIGAIPGRKKGDFEPDIALLSGQTDDSFTPSLDGLRTWLATLELK